MISAEARRQVTRLFAALEYGEQLAHDCARRQRAWIDDPRARRFLRVQARQEAAHAALYRRGAEWLSPGHGYRAPQSLRDYGRRLQRALDNDDLYDSLTGSQIVLEGFGEQILSRLNRGMDNQGVGLGQLRRLVLHQERSHHAFGLRLLARRIATEPAAAARVPLLAAEFLQQVDRIIEEMADIFLVLDEDPGEYRAELLRSLPDWICDSSA